jgi:hypothetical protein
MYVFLWRGRQNSRVVFERMRGKSGKREGNTKSGMKE